MRIIDFKNINLDKCVLLKEVSGKFNWKLYHDDKSVYKIFGKNDDDFLKNILKRIQLLYDLNINGVITPEDIVLDKNEFKGYRARYVNGSFNLSQFNNKKELNCFWYLLYKSSSVLRQIHNSSKRIIISDLRLENIIFSKELIPYFIDLDECCIGDIQADAINDSLYDYYINRGKKINYISPDTDRLCLIISTLYTIFNKEIDDIEINEYKEMCLKYKSLRNMFSLFLKLKNNKIIENVPYIDNFISLEDIKKSRFNFDIIYRLFSAFFYFFLFIFMVLYYYKQNY